LCPPRYCEIGPGGHKTRPYIIAFNIPSKENSLPSSAIQLIVGLGNPGPEYEKTRHNAGAWFVANIAKQTHVTLKNESKFSGLHALTKLAGNDCHLFIPTTFMNCSGQAVKAIASFYKILPENILIAHDEIDLPVGIVRLKLAGGHGGHNGLRDIIQKLGAPNFYRLRIGVGHPGNSKDVVDYVLKPPKKIEREEIDFSLQRAEKVLLLVVDGAFQKAMHELHSEDKGI
jgi:PTH1 family peptidyl-tRNA hydrolase